MKIYLIILTSIILFTSCANNRLYIIDSEKNWKQNKPQADSDILHSIYLIGDVGGAKEKESTIPLLQLEKHLATDNRDDQSTNVIFLGDNIYPVGMPPEGHPDRALAEHKLDVQLESVRAFDGDVTFVPGNHDWYRYGREGLHRQEKYIENYLSQYNEKLTDFFRPSDGCGNVDVMHITKDISLVFIDSHWFLSNKAKDQDFSDCDIKNRKEFAQAFIDTINTLSDKRVLINMHHPLYTVGSHGGFYTWQSHLFPLTAWKSYLYIPLPGVGTLVNYIRPRISEQDTKSEPYVYYRNIIIPTLEQHGNAIVAAGHEHTLQYHQQNNVDYIVSGSGSKRGPISSLPITKFAYSNFGYAIVDYHNNGSIWLSYFANDIEDENFIEIYRTQLK